MRTLILYKSEHGATKQYAEWINQELDDSDIFEADDFELSNLDKYSKIIIGSSVYGGKMATLEFLTENFEKLKDKRILFFTVGLIPADNTMSKKCMSPYPLRSAKISNI